MKNNNGKKALKYSGFSEEEAEAAMRDLMEVNFPKEKKADTNNYANDVDAYTYDDNYDLEAEYEDHKEQVMYSLSKVDDNKTYTLCNNCGHYDEVTKRLFAKILGGAVAGFGFWAWVSFLFAGCGFALPLCMAIVTGGVAIASYSEQIAQWLCKKYDCPECGNRDWSVLPGKALKIEAKRILLHDPSEDSSILKGNFDALEVIPVMKQVYADADKYIILSFPWYNIQYAIDDLPLMKAAIRRGVHITFWYGIKPIKNQTYEHQLEKNERTQRAINYLKENLDPEFTYFQPADTHFKVMLCDKYVLTGSHNFMSYRVWNGEKPRGENTSKISGKEAVEEFLKKVKNQPKIKNFSEYY